MPVGRGFAGQKRKEIPFEFVLAVEATDGDGFNAVATK
jgi:hypothetical protein